MVEETAAEKAAREQAEQEAANQKAAEEAAARQAEEAAAAQTPAKKVKPSSKYNLVDRFVELSGYKASDVIGHNDERRTVVTSNGGKYEVSKKGTRLRKLLGPDTPASAASEEEDDD